MVSDLKLVQRRTGFFDISVSNSLLDTVDGMPLLEQIVKLLVYSTHKPKIQYGVGIKSFRGLKNIDLISSVIGDRIARSVSFINFFYPEEAKLGELRKFVINFSAGVLKIDLKFGSVEVLV